MPFNQETTNVIHITLFIYSCVTNVTLQITSERHQTNDNLELIIIKEHQRQQQGFPVAVISTNPTIRLNIWDVLFSE